MVPGFSTFGVRLNIICLAGNQLKSIAFICQSSMRRISIERDICTNYSFEIHFETKIIKRVFKVKVSETMLKRERMKILMNSEMFKSI